MEHYNFKLKESSNKNVYEERIDEAIKKVKNYNGKNTDLKLIRTSSEQLFVETHTYNGTLKQYSVLKSEETIGYLECFIDNDYNYLSIYTSPVV